MLKEATANATGEDVDISESEPIIRQAVTIRTARFTNFREIIAKTLLMLGDSCFPGESC